MQTVISPDAQKHLPELIRDLSRKGELVIPDADKPVAKILPLPPQASLGDLKPHSVGAILQPFPSRDDDLLGEMLEPRP